MWKKFNKGRLCKWRSFFSEPIAWQELIDHKPFATVLYSICKTVKSSALDTVLIFRLYNTFQFLWSMYLPLSLRDELIELVVWYRHRSAEGEGEGEREGERERERGKGRKRQRKRKGRGEEVR